MENQAEAHILLRSFTHLADAESAAQRLIDAGIPASRFSIDARVDEAGGTRGNFAIGNGEGDSPSQGHGGYTPADNNAYEKNFKAVEWKGAFLLLVKANDVDQKAQVAALLEGCGIEPA